MADPRSRLRELVADCLVRIGIDITGAPGEGGSGVWMAPGMVLTCAHVVPAGCNSKVQVGWQGHTLTGKVIDHVPNAFDGGLWSYPDLAVVAVEDTPQHPCAWLSEAVPLGDLVAFGHSAALGETLQKAEVQGTHGGWHAFGQGRFWQFKSNELVSGMSGGPVLDTATGAVCGIVSVTIGEGADRGGYVVPIEGLRSLGAHRRRDLLIAHDRFHGGDGSWAKIRARLPHLPDFARFSVTPTEEIELLKLLAQLPAPDPDELFSLVGISSADKRIPGQPEMLRDVLYTLLDNGFIDSEIIMSVLRMIHQLVGSYPSRHHLDIYDWATVLAERHHHSEELRNLRKALAREETHVGVISVEIAPGAAKPDRFRLAVSIHQHQRGYRLIYQDKDPVHTLDQVKQTACDQLRVALNWLAGNARIEFVVPIELFDEPFEELAATKPYTNLGRKYCVVLRDYDRQFDPLTQHDWCQRWEQMRNPSRGVRWITCIDNLTPDEFSAELEQHPEVVAVALARSPSSSQQVSGMLRVALDSGMPVAAWRRGTCPDHDASAVKSACSGRRFQEAFNPLLSPGAINNLPETVRQLRNKAASNSPGAADRDCQGTVLLWDYPAPTKQLAAPVREPPYHPLENTQ